MSNAKYMAKALASPVLFVIGLFLGYVVSYNTIYSKYIQLKVQLPSKCIKVNIKYVSMYVCIKLSL